eukprot:scaffold4525_cov125-Isochrysis_galbana.AAC.5
MTTRDYPKLLERLIKLSLPVTCVVRALGGQAASLLLRCHPGRRLTRGDPAPSPRPRLQPAPPPVQLCVAGRLLRLLPRMDESAGRGTAVWRPALLQGVVERSHIRGVLAAVEPARAPLDLKARLALCPPIAKRHGT